MRRPGGGSRRAPLAVFVIAAAALAACGGSDAVTFDSTSSVPTAATNVEPSSSPPTTSPFDANASTGMTPTTTSTMETATTTTVAPVEHFGMLPVGAELPSDEYCAARVRPAKEVRSANAEFNATSGAAAPPQTGYFARVTGSFTGTTDEIIQWAACKWGIDEDIVRAQAAKESWWYQRTVSDFTDDPALCVPDHGIGVDGKDGQCPESIGLLQLRFPYIPDAFPMVSESTSYNVDYALAYRRQCFEGIDTWFNDVDHGQPYAAGDIWGCVGAWFSGRWYMSGAVEYTQAVRDYYDTKVWESGDFKSG